MCEQSPSGKDLDSAEQVEESKEKELPLWSFWSWLFSGPPEKGERKIRWENGDPGERVYVSPDCSRRQKLKGYLFFLFLAIPSLALLAIIVDLLITAILNPEDNIEDLGMVFFSLLLMILFVPWMQSMSAADYLSKHFNIYQGGLSLPERHRSLFSPCSSPEKVRFPPPDPSGNKNFLVWKDMAGYERFEIGTSWLGVAVHEKQDGPGGKKNGKHSSWSYATRYTRAMKKTGREALDRLVRELEKHGVPELPYTCPDCGTFYEESVPICFKCKKPRFGVEEGKDE